MSTSFLTNTVVDSSNHNRVIPHTIAGNIRINKDGIFINNCNLSNKLVIES